MKRLTILLAALLLSPASAYAGGAQQTPSSPYPTPSLLLIGDLLAYQRFVVPQCGDCNGVSNNVGLTAELPPVQESWADATYPFRWLAWAIQDTVRRLICWLLYALQILATFLQNMINAAISAINSVWRYSIYVWLLLREWMYFVNAGFNDVLLSLSDIQPLLIYVSVIMDLFVQILVAVVQTVAILAQSIYLFITMLFGIVGWFMALTFGLSNVIINATTNNTVPEQLDIDHPIYLLIRGFGEGIRDSEIGWALYVLWGMAYIATIWWVVKRFSNQG